MNNKTVFLFMRFTPSDGDFRGRGDADALLILEEPGTSLRSRLPLVMHHSVWPVLLH